MKTIVYLIRHGDPLEFVYWRLLNPDKQPRSYPEIRTNPRLEKGTALQLVFGSQNNMIKHEFINPL